MIRFLLWIYICSACTSCMRYKTEMDPEAHRLYQLIPPHRDVIVWYDVGHWCTWTLFGNDDDGIFGEGPCAHYRQDQPNDYAKALAWGCRNPLHNFCFYVIGSAYRKNSGFTVLRPGSGSSSLSR
jgi:hypothetical protein